MALVVSLASVQATIRRAIDSAPVDRGRIERAALLVALNGLEKVDDATYLVRSLTDASVTYTVAPDACTCEGRRRFPSRRCSHEWAARILVAAEMAQAAQSAQEAHRRASDARVALAYGLANWRPAA